MVRLYVRIYLALLVSLAVFACVAVLFWHRDGGPVEQATRSVARLVANGLPPADAPPAQQQAALQRLGMGMHGRITLLDERQQAVASLGKPLALPPGHGDRLSWPDPDGHGMVWAIYLPDRRVVLTNVALGYATTAHTLLMTLLLLGLAVSLGAYPIVRRLTQRLERLEAAVESLGAGDLSARVAVEGRDEIARLAAAFNRTAGRIEVLVGAHRQLLAHASHELRTPLARIRLALELAGPSLDPHRRAGLAQDIAELDALIDEILLASRLDAVTEPLADKAVDLLALAAEECAHYDEAQFDGVPATVRGDARLLRRLLRNLLENARRHGTPPVDVRLYHEGDAVLLTVQDAGPGIPEDERERVFEPFYRRAGTRDNIGAGLGLALVRQIALRHGGDARYVVNEGGGGFVVSLPAGAV